MQFYAFPSLIWPFELHNSPIKIVITILCHALARRLKNPPGAIVVVVMASRCRFVEKSSILLNERIIEYIFYYHEKNSRVMLEILCKRNNTIGIILCVQCWVMVAIELLPQMIVCYVLSAKTTIQNKHENNTHTHNHLGSWSKAKKLQYFNSTDVILPARNEVYHL